MCQGQIILTKTNIPIDVVIYIPLSSKGKKSGIRDLRLKAEDPAPSFFLLSSQSGQNSTHSYTISSHKKQALIFTAFVYLCVSSVSMCVPCVRAGRAICDVDHSQMS